MVLLAVIPITALCFHCSFLPYILLFLPYDMYHITYHKLKLQNGYNPTGVLKCMLWTTEPLQPTAAVKRPSYGLSTSSRTSGKHSAAFFHLRTPESKVTMWTTCFFICLLWTTWKLDNLILSSTFSNSISRIWHFHTVTISSPTLDSFFLLNSQL